MKNIIVTGGSSGIGLSLVNTLLKRGYRVINLDSKLPDNINHGSLKSIIIDLTNADHLGSCVSEIGIEYNGIDGLACVAGVGYVTKIQNLTCDDFNQQVFHNLHITYYTIKNVLPILKKNSSIVTVGSTSSYGGPGSSVAYGAAKAGVIGLTKNLAYELAPSDVRVNCVVPGAINTPLFNRLSTSTEKRMLQHFTPKGRLGEPDEVSEVIFFLLSDNSSHVVGQVLTVDGGLSIGYKPSLI